LSPIGKVQNFNLTQDLEDLSERLQESGGASMAQMEITKKQEARFQKLQ
jgi:myosin protein heavy chain